MKHKTYLKATLNINDIIENDTSIKLSPIARFF